MTGTPGRVLLGAPNEARFGFAQAARGGDLVWIAGQVAMDNATGVLAADTSLPGRLRTALGNVVRTVEAAGGTTADLAHVQVHVVGPTTGAESEMTEAWSAALGACVPAATLVPVPALAHPDYRVEVSATAVLQGPEPTRTGGAMLWQEDVPGAGAVRRGPHVAVGGQPPQASARDGDVGTQLAAAISAVGERLAAVGARLEHVVSTQVFVTGPVDADGFGRICDAHRAAFGDVRPASTLVLVDELPWPGARVQVAAVAWVEPGT